MSGSNKKITHTLLEIFSFICFSFTQLFHYVSFNDKMLSRNEHFGNKEYLSIMFFQNDSVQTLHSSLTQKMSVVVF